MPWPQEVSDWPETNPGTLVARRTAFPVGGHAVLSYLDVLAPDGTSSTEVAEALTLLRSDLQERTNPTVMVSSKITIRFGTNLGIEPRRADALDELAHVVSELHGSEG